VNVMNPVHILTPYFFDIHFNIIFLCVQYKLRTVITSTRYIFVRCYDVQVKLTTTQLGAFTKNLDVYIKPMVMSHVRIKHSIVDNYEYIPTVLQNFIFLMIQQCGSHSPMFHIFRTNAYCVYCDDHW